MSKDLESLSAPRREPGPSRARTALALALLAAAVAAALVLPPRSAQRLGTALGFSAETPEAGP